MERRITKLNCLLCNLLKIDFPLQLLLDSDLLRVLELKQLSNFKKVIQLYLIQKDFLLVNYM